MNFADLIAPVPVAHFLDAAYDRQPLHIPADGEAGECRRAIFSWAGLNALLGIAGHWREENLKLILDGGYVPGDQYLEQVATRGGMAWRSDPARIEALLALGASLVADAADDGSAALKQVSAMLSGEFLGTSSANVYCSFQGKPTFRTHLDLHDVFAVHAEGEKVWRIYRNRAPDPVEQPAGPDAQAEIDRARGPVLMEVRMRPGDLLYIPRGYYHDALASTEASLHVTFSVARHTGRVLFRVLEEMVMLDPAFRAYLPDGRTDGGAVLAGRIEALAARAAEWMRTPAFRQAVTNRQLELARRFRTVTLPDRAQPSVYLRTRHPWQIVPHHEGTVLAWNGGQAPLGLLEAPARWFLGQDSASFQQLAAHYPQHGEQALGDLVQLLQRAGLVEPQRG